MNINRNFAPVTLAATLMLTSCAPWNTTTRRVPYHGSAMASDSEIATIPPGDSPYIESNGESGQKYGCSFIEFDGKGGFLDYNQYVHAQRILKERAASSHVLLVLYCHGWNNNAQSADVIRFMSFLRRLSVSADIRNARLRVEGVYLSWRGSQYVQSIGESDEKSDPSLHVDFNQQDLVDHGRSLPPIAGTLLEPLSLGSYFSIKDRAELHISRVELARAIFGLAYTLKNPEQPEDGRDNHVFVIGHSFGALALEQTLGQASVALLSSQWGGYTQDRWPFDLIVFLNSAAPSLYAKQLQDFLITDHHATLRPRIVSITSTGDWATGTMHHVGNLPNRYFAPDLQRPYYPRGYPGKPYTAGYYYDYTPGHNPMLINGCIEEDDTLPTPDPMTWLFGYNLHHAGSGAFFAHDSYTNKIHGFRLYPGPLSMPSNYWIITVPKNIIKWHLDVWTDTSMEMLAGIYSMIQHIPATPVAETRQYATPNQN